MGAKTATRIVAIGVGFLAITRTVRASTFSAWSIHPRLFSFGAKRSLLSGLLTQFSV